MERQIDGQIWASMAVMKAVCCVEKRAVLEGEDLNLPVNLHPNFEQ